MTEQSKEKQANEQAKAQNLFARFDKKHKPNNSKEDKEK